MGNKTNGKKVVRRATGFGAEASVGSLPPAFSLGSVVQVRLTGGRSSIEWDRPALLTYADGWGFSLVSIRRLSLKVGSQNGLVEALLARNEVAELVRLEHNGVQGLLEAFLMDPCYQKWTMEENASLFADWLKERPFEDALSHLRAFLNLDGIRNAVSFENVAVPIAALVRSFGVRVIERLLDDEFTARATEDPGPHPGRSPVQGPLLAMQIALAQVFRTKEGQGKTTICHLVERLAGLGIKDALRRELLMAGRLITNWFAAPLPVVLDPVAHEDSLYRSLVAEIRVLNPDRIPTVLRGLDGCSGKGFSLEKVQHMLAQDAPSSR